MILPPDHPLTIAAKKAQEKREQETVQRGEAGSKKREEPSKIMVKQKKRRGKGYRSVPLESLAQINHNAAGLDVGTEEIWGCVPEGRDEGSVRVYETFTVDLYDLAEWLAECGVTTVAMESTGVYWIPVYEVLAERGFEVYLVNARHVKNVTGRKTDIEDCQWLQQLHTYGLLRASFVPDEEIGALRSYVRQRESLMRYRSSHIQHMQKALSLMNVQLANVITDITGQTGMQIIRAIVAGQQDPVKLAQYRDPRCKSSEATIAKALQGHYREEHLFALQQALALYDVYTEKISACEAQLEKRYQAFAPQVDPEAEPLPKRKRPKRANEPDFDLRSYLYQMTGVDLTAIDGVDALTVQEVIAEVGLDMSKWPTVKHFTAWLGLAPNNKITGGKVKSRATQKTTNRASTAFRLAAQGVARSQSAVGAFYRRKRAQLGKPKAITATAHKIARIFYVMLKNKEAYHDPGADAYEEQYRQRAIANLKRKAKKLGLTVAPAVG